MATTLQQLLDDVAGRTDGSTEMSSRATIEDAVGALGHAGWALHRLAGDGLDTQVGSPRERMVQQLAAACHAVAGLWPPAAGGQLTDLMGAAADIAGRARSLMGRSERWGITTEFAAAADHCAEWAHQLVPLAAVVELADVRRAAAAIERAAQANPPAPQAGAILDRLVPVSQLPPGLTGSQVAAEASAALVTAIARADDRGGLTLREFRAVLATAEIGSRYVAAVAAALPGGGDGPQPGRNTAVAWQVAGHSAAVFEDGAWTRRTERTDVVAWAGRLPEALSHDLGPASGVDAATLSGRPDLPQILVDLQQIANQTPLIADQLTSTARRWAAEGTLRGYAADLPRMENFPEQLIGQVLAGQRIMAAGAHLDPMITAISRAGSLSTALADELNRTATASPPTQPHLAATYAARLSGPEAADGLTRDAHAVEQALAATRAPFQTAPSHRSPGPGPDR